MQIKKELKKCVFHAKLMFLPELRLRPVASTYQSELVDPSFCLFNEINACNLHQNKSIKYDANKYFRDDTNTNE